jgi:protease-4
VLCRSFTPEEASLWEESAQYAYSSFRDKAAESRNMPIEDMQVRPAGGGS